MKKPPTKKEKPLLAAPLAYGRLRRPTPSASPPLLFRFFGGCASFSCPLRASLSSCGRLRRPSSLLLLSRFFRAAGAARPLPLLFLFSSLLRRLRRLTLPRALVGGWRRPPRPLLFPLYQTINKPLTPSHVMNLSVLHLTSLPLVTLKGRYRKPLAFFIFCHNCLNV